MVATFPQDISVSLSFLYVPEVYPRRWSILEDYPSHPDACSTITRPVRGGCPPRTSALHFFQTRLSIMGPPQSLAPPRMHSHY